MLNAVVREANAETAFQFLGGVRFFGRPSSCAVCLRRRSLSMCSNRFDRTTWFGYFRRRAFLAMQMSAAVTFRPVTRPPIGRLCSFFGVIWRPFLAVCKWGREPPANRLSVARGRDAERVARRRSYRVSVFFFVFFCVPSVFEEWNLNVVVQSDRTIVIEFRAWRPKVRITRIDLTHAHILVRRFRSGALTIKSFPGRFFWIIPSSLSFWLPLSKELYLLRILKYREEIEVKENTMLCLTFNRFLLFGWYGFLTKPVT